MARVLEARQLPVHTTASEGWSADDEHATPMMVRPSALIHWMLVLRPWYCGSATGVLPRYSTAIAVARSTAPVTFLDMRRLVPLAVLVPLLVACGGSPASRPAEAPVSAVDAAATLHRVAAFAAERTPGSAKLVCDTLADSCDGLSGSYRANPTSAPLSPPSIVCDIALPALPGQTGPRILVITGRDAADREYAGQVLVLRRNGHVVLHEPAFWNGIRYSQLAGGRAWDGISDDPSLRAAHDAAVRSACTDPTAFATAVTTTTTPSRHPR